MGSEVIVSRVGCFSFVEALLFPDRFLNMLNMLPIILQVRISFLPEIRNEFSFLFKIGEFHYTVLSPCSKNW